MKALSIPFLSASFLTLAAVTQAAAINLATGLDSSGNLQTAGDLLDANWTITGSNTYKGTVGQAFTVDPTDGDWYGGWFANGTSSSWIAADPDTSNNGLLDAKLTFTLTANQLATASFQNCMFALDDAGEIDLNGVQQATVGNGQWGAFTNVNMNTANLVVGLNTIDLKVTYSDDYLEAVRFQGQLVEPAPEPVTMLLGTGAFIAVAKRRRSMN